MAKNGGARPGAGRPKGSGLAQKSQEHAKKLLLDEGLTPLEVMVQSMRYYYELADRESQKINGFELDESNKEKFKQITMLRREADTCAANAAGYIHPKLTAISAPNGGPIQLGLEVSFVKPNHQD